MKAWLKGGLIGAGIGILGIPFCQFLTQCGEAEACMGCLISLWLYPPTGFLIGAFIGVLKEIKAKTWIKGGMVGLTGMLILGRVTTDYYHNYVCDSGSCYNLILLLLPILFFGLGALIGWLIGKKKQEVQ